VRTIQAVLDAQIVLVAVLDERNALDQLHDEERPPRLRRSRIQHPSDVGMVHHRQSLPLLLEARDDLHGVHAQLDDLQRDLALDGPLLLGHEDGAEPALADGLQNLVGAADRFDALLNVLSEITRCREEVPAMPVRSSSWMKCRSSQRGPTS
jgi:hypothetical protein